MSDADWLGKTQPARLGQAADDAYDGEHPQPAVGDVWRGYRLRAALGRATGRFLANQLAVGNREVLIRFSPDAHAEAARLGQLEHARIARVHCVVCDDATNLSALCLEYSGRVTLADVLDSLREAASPRLLGDEISRAIAARSSFAEPFADSPLDPPRDQGSYLESALRCAEQLADALAHAHAHRACHLQLWPMNVVLAANGSPTLCDAHPAGAEPPGANLRAETLCYMSPEQLRSWVLRASNGAEVGPAADVYCWGVMLHELLTGDLPYPRPEPNRSLEESARRLLHARRRVARPRLIRYRPVHGKLANLLARSLSFQPGQRPSAKQLVEEVGGILRDLQPPSPATRRTRTTRRRARIMLASVLVCATVLAAVARWHQTTWPRRAWRGAWDAYTARDYDGCARWTSQILGREPGDVDALVMRGLARQESREFSLALTDLARANGLSPDPLIQACQGACYGRAGQPLQSRVLYKQAVQGGLNSDEVRTGLAHSQILVAEFAEAESELERVLEKHPRHQLALFLRATLEYQRARHQHRACSGKGLDAVRRALETGPAVVELHVLAAKILARQAGTDDPRIREADGYLRQALAHGADLAEIQADDDLQELFRRAPDLLAVSREAVHDWPQSMERYVSPLSTADWRTLADPSLARFGPVPAKTALVSVSPPSKLKPVPNKLAGQKSKLP